MNRPNFDKQMQDALQTVPQGTPLLLHSCCGPCSTRCIEELKQTFSVTVPAGSAPVILCRAYNGYDQYTESIAVLP